jgi:hypothetical protein
MRNGQMFHQRPPLTHPGQPWSNEANSQASSLEAEQRACVTCEAITCDDCRIHLVCQDTWSNCHWKIVWSYVFLDPELRYCGPTEDRNGDDPWAAEEGTHNDLDYGQSHEADIGITLRDCMNLIPPLDTAGY